MIFAQKLVSALMISTLSGFSLACFLVILVRLTFGVWEKIFVLILQVTAVVFLLVVCFHWHRSLPGPDWVWFMAIVASPFWVGAFSAAKRTGFEFYILKKEERGIDTRPRPKRKGPKNPIMEAAKGFLVALTVPLLVMLGANWVGYENRALYQMGGIVMMICPFVFAAWAWEKASEDLKKFMERNRLKREMPLPEIDLDERSPDNEFGKTHVKVGRVEDQGLPSNIIELIDAWERMEKMDDGPTKEILKKILEKKVEKLERGV